MLHDARMANLSKLLDVAQLRARVHAGNIANQSTPGYKARAVSFETAWQEAMQRGEEAAAAVEPEIFEPRTSPTDIDGNDVDLDREVTLASQNQVLYNAYIQMMRGKHRLLSTAIGRGQ